MNYYGHLSAQRSRSFSLQVNQLSLHSFRLPGAGPQPTTEPTMTQQPLAGPSLKPQQTCDTTIQTPVIGEIGPQSSLASPAGSPGKDSGPRHTSAQTTKSNDVRSAPSSHMLLQTQPMIKEAISPAIQKEKPSLDTSAQDAFKLMIDSTGPNTKSRTENGSEILVIEHNADDQGTRSPKAIVLTVLQCAGAGGITTLIYKICRLIPEP